ncbi:MAG: Jag N-terminal domain-containing protein [Acidimicrobiia bacterium]|nr:Jag N-terminal domain-containing protein [Acidimicrobiia bacterium]
MEWVEVKGKTVDVAVEVAMQELNITDRSRVAVEVVQEPEKGFLGIGGKDAIVRVKPAAGKGKRRRRTRKGGEGQNRAGRSERGSGDQPERRRNGRQQEDRPQGDHQQRDRQQRDRQQGERPSEQRAPRNRKQSQREVDVSVEEQAPVVEEFLKGLVDAFGLEGDVKVSQDDDIIVAELVGDQTEALVGPKGVVMEAVHELTKTVLQRKTQSSARLRLDVAGYAERRRQALTIYANRLIDQLVEDGGELMLEPMSASDRKVIHDAGAAREGVSTYSEGTAPQRYVVLVKEGEPTGGGNVTESDRPASAGEGEDSEEE